jgi:hypothetical protein
VDVSGGHHDAGDYGKYTINSAAFIHHLVFAVDLLPGAAELDNLGLPESGDGIPDLLQEAKWEADFLAKLQDDDGGFYFLVYPKSRRYENDVLPDAGDQQIVWPKNTAATAAAVAALAQAGSSPRMRKHFPAAADNYLARAKRGWQFLQDALARHGHDGAYQKLTHYGHGHRHNDELAWAACELFLATGEARYHDWLRKHFDPADDRTRRWGWWRLNESYGNAIRSYAFAVRTGRRPAKSLDRLFLEKCEREIDQAGRDVLRWSDESSYGTSFPSPTKRMRGGGWYFSIDQAFDLAVASQLDYPRENDPRPRQLEAFIANLNFEAGANPLNRPYVTGLGVQRQREIVHQFAQVDGRVLPPSGIPIGNVQSGQPWIGHYERELGGLSFPPDGDQNAPYPFYDRWTDTANVATEFVIVNQARALAGLAWLAGKTEACGCARAGSQRGAAHRATRGAGRIATGGRDRDLGGERTRSGRRARIRVHPGRARHAVGGGRGLLARRPACVWTRRLPRGQRASHRVGEGVATRGLGCPRHPRGDRVFAHRRPGAAAGRELPSRRHRGEVERLPARGRRYAGFGHHPGGQGIDHDDPRAGCRRHRGVAQGAETHAGQGRRL